MTSGGLNKEDKILKNNGLLTINDIKKLLNKGRATIETVIKYLYIKPTEIVGTHKFYSNNDFEKIKSFYAEHNDYEKFLAKEMRIRKYGENPYKNRDIKTKQTLIEKYGENYIEVLNQKRNDSIEEKYGNKNYRNVEQQKETLYKNRIDFCKENNCSIFSEIFGTRIEHSWETLEKCLNNSKIKLINYKTVLYIKNDDVEKLQEELNKIQYSNTSFSEKEIVDFIKSLNFNVIENDRNIIKPKELDIYIPSKKLAIEFDGLFYHSDLFVDKNYHLNKTLECSKHGIKLLHIFEDEWLYKKEICKSIIRNLLGVSEQIYANDCTIKEIDYKTYHDFLNVNDILGYSKCKYKVGLFYNGELVQCIGISPLKIEGKFKIIRFCNKTNIDVINGLNKLILYLKDKYDINSITCNIDRRIFNYDVFITNDFKIIGYSNPSFQYFKEHKRINKQDKKLLKNNIYKIYDCGTVNLELNF